MTDDEKQEQIDRWRGQIADMIQCLVRDGVLPLDAFEIVRTLVVSVENEAFAIAARLRGFE